MTDELDLLPLQNPKVEDLERTVRENLRRIEEWSRRILERLEDLDERLSDVEAVT